MKHQTIRRFRLGVVISLAVAVSPAGRADDCNSNGVPDAGDIAHRASADCNANGLPDECELFPGKKANIAGMEPQAIAALDLNGDGSADLATANFGSGDVSVRLGNGDGTFQDHRRFAAGPYPAALAARDLNGDGRADLAIAGSSYIIVLLNEGPEPCEFGGLQLPGDANQDGQLDLSDAIWLLEHLFLGTVKNLPCEGQTAGDPGNGERRLLDSNGDKQIDLSDAVGVLVFLFLGNAPPVLGTHCVAIPGCPDACRP